MSLFKQYRIGFSSFFQAIPFIFKNGLSVYFIFPVILQVVLFIGGFVAVGSSVDLVVEYITSWWDIKSWDFPLSEYMGDVIYWFFWLIIKISFFLIFSYFSGYIVLIFMSPVLAYLSEKTEEILTGKKYKFDIFQLVRDITRGVVVALRNVFFEILLTILIILIGFIPLVGILSPFLLFMVTAYYYGFSFIDYNNERKQYSFKKSVKLMRKYKAMLIGVATPFTAVLLIQFIPFIGQFLAGFAAIVATVGGVIAYQKIGEEENIQKMESIKR